MTTSRKSMLCCFALLLCFNAATLLAQSAAPQCFSIHVRLNGKPLDGPRVIALRTEQTESTASLEEGCFKVPPASLTEKALDVFFTVGRNKIYLARIATGFFVGPWDIDLADKKFGSEVSLPKHARAREACAVVFHVGEPERALTQTNCRKLLPDAAPKAGKERDLETGLDYFGARYIQAIEDLRVTYPPREALVQNPSKQQGPIHSSIEEHDCNIDASRIRRISDFEQAALRKVKPEYPPEAKNKGALIQLQLLVDRSGDVKGACPIDPDSESKLDPNFVMAAQKAALRWKFPRNFGARGKLHLGFDYAELTVAFNFAPHPTASSIPPTTAMKH